jgi:outer membrane murein-binding lipoprotein Lpp
MKRSKWLLIGSVVVCLALVLLAGCGVSMSEHEALQAEYATLQSDLTDLQADYEAASEELAEIKEVYPPRDFSSLSELQDWLLANDVSERPAATIAETLYSKALEIQEDALEDGYIVSAEVYYDETTELFYIDCTTIINGDLWWWDPETDEPIQWYALGKVK